MLKALLFFGKQSHKKFICKFKKYYGNHCIWWFFFPFFVFLFSYHLLGQLLYHPLQFLVAIFFLLKLPKFIKRVRYFTELQLTLFAFSKFSVNRSLSVVMPTASSPLTNFSDFMYAFFILMTDLTKELNVSAILKSLIFSLPHLLMESTATLVLIF